MFKLTKVTGVFALGVLSCAVSGQAQAPQHFSRDICVKVRDGKSQEFTGFLRDVTTKLAKVRIDSGIYSSFLIARAEEPLGRSAVCDYHLVYGFIGFPQEAPTPEQTSADLKKAGIAMTFDQMTAKRDELSYAVGVDLWRAQESVGSSLKGGYARLNYYKTKPGMVVADWIRMESSGWKLLAETVAQETPGMAWWAATLVMPGGTSLPYNGLTVDSFPSWAALGKGIPTRAIWNKVHPEMDMATYLSRVGTLVERPRVDIVKLIEVLHDSKTSGPGSTERR
jgi:hypothetical protein